METWLGPQLKILNKKKISTSEKFIAHANHTPYYEYDTSSITSFLDNVD